MRYSAKFNNFENDVWNEIGTNTKILIHKLVIYKLLLYVCDRMELICKSPIKEEILRNLIKKEE
jgi:hypothetical protein